MPDLLAAFEHLPRPTQRRAVWLLGQVGDRRAAPLLLRLFEEARFCPATCVALSIVGGRRALRSLMGVVEGELERPRRHRDLGRLTCALAALQTLDGNEAATDLFLDVARRRDLPPYLRGWAIEGLGMIAEEAVGPRPRAREVRALVRDALDDPSPTIRGHAVVAAGLMRLHTARRRLTQIAERDRARVAGLGGLGALARAALRDLGP